MLSKAQAFLASLFTLFATFPEPILELQECQELLENFYNNNTRQFLENFFKPIKIVQNDNIKPLILNFNKNILNIHIKAKNVGTFSPISTLSIPLDDNCQCGSTDFVENEGYNQCENCGIIFRNQLAVAWSDVSRVHASPAYLYDRKVQFKELLLGFQGKCQHLDDNIIANIVFPKNVSKVEFLNCIKQSNRQKISMDQVHGLYYRYRNIEPPSLTLLENYLLKDFDKFTNIYSSIISHTSPLVSNQFLLFQFLKRYKYPVTKDDVLLPEVRPDKESILIFKMLDWPIYSE